MAANKVVRFGPAALTTTLTTNIIEAQGVTAAAGTPIANPESSTSTYFIIRHIRITNKDTVARTFSLWLGATGANVAGTEVIGTAVSVAANSFFEWFGMLRMDFAVAGTRFLVGGASANTTLTFQAEGEMGIS